VIFGWSHNKRTWLESCRTSSLSFSLSESPFSKSDEFLMLLSSGSWNLCCFPHLKRHSKVIEMSFIINSAKNIRQHSRPRPLMLLVQHFFLEEGKHIPKSFFRLACLLSNRTRKLYFLAFEEDLLSSTRHLMHNKQENLRMRERPPTQAKKLFKRIIIRKNCSNTVWNCRKQALQGKNCCFAGCLRKFWKR